MDVVEHLDDDVVALREYFRVLSPGGALLLTVPAYMSMWSEHDEWAAHRRRYRGEQLTAAVEAAGFEVERWTYYNSFLVPPAWLLRRTPLRRLVKGSNDEVGASSALVDRIFTGLSAVERRWARRRRVPFGLSILLVAQKPTSGVPGDV
jgi:SAM-dependent methyltransferase